MNKKLMAVAVAGALAMPGLALAQSSVTIGGFFKVGIEQIKYDSANAARTGLNSSEIRVSDNSSRIIFGVSEDLGGGLSAIAQLDNRFAPDNGAIAATGNTWVGLKSSSWGSLTIGRHDLHYGQNASDMGAQASALKATSISLMDYVNIVAVPAGGTATPTSFTYGIARTTRTPNSIKWQSPNWSGFDMILAYSTNAGAGYPSSLLSTAAAGIGDSNADLAPCFGAVPAGSCRKGYAWNFNPHFTAENWGLGYSYWNSKPDAILLEEKGQNAFGYFKWSGFKIGVSYNQSQLKAFDGLGGMEDVAKRDAWSIPLSWNSGPHTIYAHYTKANKDKAAKDAAGNTIGGTDAAMAAVAYNYALSKRTSVGITYAQIRNSENAAYNFFTDTGGAGSGLTSLGAGAKAGEDPKLLALIMYHAF